MNSQMARKGTNSHMSYPPPGTPTNRHTHLWMIGPQHQPATEQEGDVEDARADNEPDDGG